MKKAKLIMLILALVAASLFASCTSPTAPVASTPSEPSSSAAASAPTPSAPSSAVATPPPVKEDVIRVWSDNAHEQELRQQQISEFNAGRGKELGIKIEYTVYGTNWADTIKIAATADDAPELYRPNVDFIRDFVNAGYLVPLTDLPGSEQLIKPYEGDLVVNSHIFNDKVYCLPYNLTTYKFIYNKDLFDKNNINDIPDTWDKVVKYANIITQNGGGNEYGFVMAYNNAAWTISTGLFRPNAANTGHIGFNNATLQFDFSAFSPVFNAVGQMVRDGSVFPGATGLDADTARAQFAEGRVGMIWTASFDTGVYNTQFPAKCDWKVIPPPAYTSDGLPYKEFVDATNLLGVGKAALDLPEKSLEVYKFFYSDECMAQMYEKALYIPYRQEAIALAKSAPAEKGFAEFANVPDSVLILPMPNTLIKLEGDEYRTVLMNWLTDGAKGDVAEVLAEVDARYNKALADVPAASLEEFKAPAGQKVKAGE